MMAAPVLDIRVGDAEKIPVYEDAGTIVLVPDVLPTDKRPSELYTELKQKMQHPKKKEPAVISEDTLKERIAERLKGKSKLGAAKERIHKLNEICGVLNELYATGGRDESEAKLREFWAEYRIYSDIVKEIKSTNEDFTQLVNPLTEARNSVESTVKSIVEKDCFNKESLIKLLHEMCTSSYMGNTISDETRTEVKKLYDAL